MTIDTERAMTDLVAKGIKIPPQPRVLIELRKVMASEDYDVRSLAKIISTDTGISAMLFKLARSPVFGRGKEFQAIDQVIMMVGPRQTYNLVQAMALTSSVSGAMREALDNFWTRSQEIAQLAAMIAADSNSIYNVLPDQAYMAGIFHKCGVPVLMQRFPDYCTSLQQEHASYWPDLTEENERFGVDHCNVGYIVAKHWALPDFVCAAIKYQYEVPREELGTTCTLVAIIQLASHFYHRVIGVADQPWMEIGAEVLSELGLDALGEQEYFEDISERFLAS